VSSAEHERLLRRARMQDVALFRYRLIGPALEEGLSTRQRGRVVRGIAGQVHAGPGGRGVQVSRKTIDRWTWRTGGFEALLPDDRKCEPVTPEPVLAMAAALKRENMARTAAQVRRIMVASSGDAPSERTLQRHFVREDLTTPRGSTVFGRFEATALVGCHVRAGAEPGDFPGSALVGFRCLAVAGQLPNGSAQPRYGFVRYPVTGYWLTG
jgi:putative transposase